MKKLIYSLLFIFLIVMTGCVTKNKEINSKSQLEDFYKKPSIILFGATSCNHCQKAIPIFKEKVYDVYSSDMNIWINVIDGKEFNIDIPQGLNENLDFEIITKSECEYVPSWIILNKEGEVVKKSCGGEKEMSEIISAIEKII